jgi:flagellar biosynthesis regulator FlbT
MHELSVFTNSEEIDNGKRERQLMSDEEIYKALRKARAEISRLNEASGEKVFNPAATNLVDSSLYELWGRINTHA